MAVTFFDKSYAYYVFNKQKTKRVHVALAAKTVSIYEIFLFLYSELRQLIT